MPSAVSVAGDVAAAAMALAGLVLVFLGATAISFDSYEKSAQNSVRAKYQRRAWFAFSGFVAALLASLFALIGRWIGQECVAVIALAFLAAAIVILFFVALSAVKDIR